MFVLMVFKHILWVSLSRENLILLFANKKGKGQLAHLGILISALVIHFQESISTGRGTDKKIKILARLYS